MSAPSGLTAGRLGQGRLPIHAQGAVQRISGAGWADEVGGQTIGRVALFTANALRGSAVGGWLPGGLSRRRIQRSKGLSVWPRPATGKVWSALRPGRNRVCTGSG